ncbi:hypothetical protein JCM10049v2_006022 [Rhodotorula toruloides]
MEALTKAAGAMTLGDEQHDPMLRPGYGTVGKPFSVYMNAYEIRTPNLVAYHYDVKIKPDKPVTPPRLNREIWRYLDQTLNAFNGIAVAFDGRSMAYSPKKLPADEGQWNITLPDEDGGGGGAGRRTFTVTIRFTRPIDLARLGVFVRGEGLGEPSFPDQSQVQSAIQALNVLIQHGPTLLYPSRQASFFLPPMRQEEASIARGLAMWRGFVSSVRMGPGRVFLNLDIASQPMVQAGNLPRVVLNFLRGTNRNLTEQHLDAKTIPSSEYIRLGRFLKGLKVKLTVKDADGIEPTRKVRGIEGHSANDPAHAFQIDGTTYTIASYFEQFYGVKLRNPNFPVISVSKVARWPLELCVVEAGQKWTKKLDPEQTVESIRLTTVAPRERLGNLSEGLKRIQPSDAALGQWGIKIDQKPLEAKARLLTPPTVNFKGRAARINNGVWDVRGHQLYTSARIERWLVLVLDSPQYFQIDAAQTCIVGLVAACQQMGITYANPRPPIHYAPRGADTAAFMREKGMEMMQEQGGPPQLIVCFLPRKPCSEYAEIKKFGDQQVGCATQCLYETKAKRGSPGYWQNVALKISVKLHNGINWILNPQDLGPIAEKPTLVIGADVSHAQPNSVAPSVAAIVGSMDQTCSIYGSAITVQPSRLEVIARLEEMVLKLLRQFLKRNGFFFRDGISEGQFPQVIATEVEAVRKAAQRFGAEHNQHDYAPKLTFLCCGKRHHVSLFPSQTAYGDPKTGNVKSGTVVDTEVVSPFHFDWYSMAHQPLLGTGRSCHLTVLRDDSNFTADQLQQLTFNLAFTYAKATRSVSVPTPAYYASRLCTRAQLLLKREDEDTTTVISSTSNSSDERLRQQALAEYSSRLKAIHPNHEETLFFM